MTSSKVYSNYFDTGLGTLTLLDKNDPVGYYGDNVQFVCFLAELSLFSTWVEVKVRQSVSTHH